MRFCSSQVTVLGRWGGRYHLTYMITMTFIIWLRGCPPDFSTVNILFFTLEEILRDCLNILLLLKLLPVKFSVEGLTCNDGFCGSLPALPKVLRSFCHYQLELYLKEGASLLPHLFIYVFDYLFMSRINLVSGLPSSIIIIYSVAPKSFSHGPAFAEHFLTSAPQDMGSYHIFPFFFSEELWVLLLENDV